MLDIQKFIGKPEIFFNKIDERTHIFEVQYLPRGFGHTIGNGIRRLIFGYNLSGAITGIKIKGISHEYQIIDGVKDSVLDIMLNFKKVRFGLNENVDKLQWFSQRFTGMGKYYSNNLKLQGGIENFSDDVYLFEITDDNVEIVIDYRVEKGYGYYNLDFLRKREEKQENKDVGILLIDNDFKLIDYLKYDVEEVIDDFIGGSKDKLTIEIKTISEKINPKDLLNFASEVIISYLKLFLFSDSYVDKSILVDYYDLESRVESTNDIEIKTVPIDALPLSERTRNALIKNDILYVEDLEKKKKNELLGMKGVGRKAVDEIVQSLKNLGKNLAG